MAKVVGLTVPTAQTIWKVHRLAPRRARTFRLSNDPAFAEKLHHVVGLYVAPPAHAVALSFDEKSQFQTLDRTLPGLPLMKGRGPTMTHDCKRHGTVTDRDTQRHRYQEFIRVLDALERDIPAGKAEHIIPDNYAARKHAKVHAWLDRYPRWTFHFIPTPASWPNAAEGFFAKPPRRRLGNGVFRSLVDLLAAINRLLAEHNQNPKPFIRRAEPDAIIAA